MRRAPRFAFWLSLASVLLLTAPSAPAIEVFKTSGYGGAHQIWFEAEDYDERNPDTDAGFALTDEPGAYGRSITNASGDDGRYLLRYDFDISKAGGIGGTWYFWGRVINANNRSCFMLVEGHPGDPMPVTLPMTGLTNGMRVFEDDIGSTWTWGNDSGNEGHTKTLRDGQNTMWLLSREDQGIMDVFMWTDDPAYVPTDADYENAQVASKARASSPRPASGAVDVPYYTDRLSWSAGEFAATHTVYFGTGFDDVNEASVDEPRGVLLAQGLTEPAVAVTLDLETTYYWRVDEVNAPPDRAVHRGEVWTFEVEPVSYPVAGVGATASSTFTPEMTADKTVGDTGVNADGTHSINMNEMWLSAAGQVPGAQIVFDLGGVEMLEHARVWNHNSQTEAVLGYGIQQALIETSADGGTFTELKTVDLPQASGKPSYRGTELPLDRVLARYVRITALSNHSRIGLTQAGLAAVRFYSVPVASRELNPAHGTRVDRPAVELSWRSGRFAVDHRVVFDSDLAAVRDGRAVIETTAGRRATVAGLDYAGNYYWRIIDVAADGTSYPSAIQRLLVSASGVIDDMETYSNEAGERIYEFWADGYDNPDTNGSVVGNGDDPETTIVYEGGQSLPLAYDNAKPRSEATRSFDPPLDLTEGRPASLDLAFRGLAYAFNGYYSADGSNWTAMSWNPRYAAMTEDTLIGLAVTSHDVAAAATAVYTQVATTGDVTGTWTQTDLGGPHPAGSFTGADGVFTIQALGADIWGTADDFRYVHKTLHGAGSITAQVKSLEPVNAWTKVGVMIRDSDDVDSSFAAVYATGANGVRYQARLASGIDAVSDSGVVDGTQELLNPPVWIRVERAVANAPGVFYLTVTDTAGRRVKVPHPDAAATQRGWTRFRIPLADLAGLDTSSIASLTLGVEGPSGTGTVYVDDLHVAAAQLVAEPVDPGSEALLAHYALDGDLRDSSGNALDGTSVNPTFVAGVAGSALAVDAADPGTVVDLGLRPEFNVPGDLSVSLWANLDPGTQPWSSLIVNRGEGDIGWSVRRQGGNDRITFTVRNTLGEDNPLGDVPVVFGEWFHFAGVYKADRVAGERRTYVNGEPDLFFVDGGVIGAASHNVYLGARANEANDGLERILTGMIDEVRVYTRPLTEGEVRFLAGL